MDEIGFWRRISVRIALLLVVVVSVLGGASLVLFNRIFNEASQSELAALVTSADVRSVIIYLIAVFLLTLLGATVFSRTLLIEPIEGLLKGTKDIAEGKLGVRLEANANSELGVLAQMFNEMSENLAKQTQELVQTNQALKASEQLLEQRVAERTEQLSALLELSNYTVVTLELEPLLSRILDKLKSVVDFTEASVFVQQDMYRLKLLYYRGPAKEQLLQNYCDVRDVSTVATVIQERKAVAIEDVTADPNLSKSFHDFVASYLGSTRLDMVAWLCLPIIVRDKVIGLMTLEHTIPSYYNEQRLHFAMAFASQVGVALENIRLYAEAQENAALEERRHLARELHDSVSQALFGITLGIDTAIAQAKRNPAKLDEPLSYVKNLARAGLAEMRALIFELRPESLEQEGLVVALGKQAEAMRARYQIDLQLKVCEEPTLAFRCKQALYRVSQEALHNISKHARATRVDMTLWQDEDDIRLAIHDNGVGFDTSARFPKSLGLTSMRERIEALGGDFDLHSGTGQGTRIEVSVPVLSRAEDLETATLSIGEGIVGEDIGSEGKASESGDVVVP